MTWRDQRPKKPVAFEFQGSRYMNLGWNPVRWLRAIDSSRRYIDCRRASRRRLTLIVKRMTDFFQNKDVSDANALVDLYGSRWSGASQRCVRSVPIGKT